MKRANNLFDLIATHENLRIAFRKASKGKQAKRETIKFRNNFDANIQLLQNQILAGEPDVGNYRFFVVRDPKVRNVCAASFSERVLHHAVMNVCEPVLDSYSIDDSYACRHGKGNQKAIVKAMQFMSKYSWYLKLDIRKYFDSIHHDIMMQMLARRYKEEKLLALFQIILNTFHTQQGQGLPIGNLISQHLANFYLGHFDHWVKEKQRINGYVRYMDDFILFSNDKLKLKTELGLVENFLKRHLGLSLKYNIQLNRSSFGVPFLGFRIFPNHIRLMAQTKKRFSKKFRGYEKNYYQGNPSSTRKIHICNDCKGL